MIPTGSHDESLLANESESNNIKYDIESSKSHTEMEKRALILKYYSKADYEEISNQLGLSQSNVRKIISRGLSKLKSKYQGGENE